VTSPEPWAIPLILRLARRSRDLHSQGLTSRCELCREAWPCQSARRAAAVIDSLTRDSPARADGNGPIHPDWLAGGNSGTS